MWLDTKMARLCIGRVHKDHNQTTECCREDLKEWNEMKSEYTIHVDDTTSLRIILVSMGHGSLPNSASTELE
jgi:hypothetical protein